MLSLVVDFMEGNSVVAWHEHLLTVTTPTILRVPKGNEWIILRVRAVDPLPEDAGLLVLTVDESTAGLTIPAPRFRCQKCEGKPLPGGLHCLRCNGSGQEPAGVPAIFKGTLPPQRRILSIAALRAAEARLGSTAVSVEIQTARAAIERCAAAIEQHPSAEAMRALTEALSSAQLAWRSFIQEVAPVLTPLRVQAQRGEQRVRFEHRAMQLGGAPGATLPALTVELALFHKNDNEAMPLIQEHPTKS